MSATAEAEHDLETERALLDRYRAWSTFLRRMMLGLQTETGGDRRYVLHWRPDVDTRVAVQSYVETPIADHVVEVIVRSRARRIVDIWEDRQAFWHLNIAKAENAIRQLRETIVETEARLKELTALFSAYDQAE